MTYHFTALISQPSNVHCPQLPHSGQSINYEMIAHAVCHKGQEENDKYPLAVYLLASRGSDQASEMSEKLWKEQRKAVQH